MIRPVKKPPVRSKAVAAGNTKNENFIALAARHARHHHHGFPPAGRVFDRCFSSARRGRDSRNSQCVFAADSDHLDAADQHLHAWTFHARLERASRNAGRGDCAGLCGREFLVSAPIRRCPLFHELGAGGESEINFLDKKTASPCQKQGPARGVFLQLSNATLRGVL